MSAPTLPVRIEFSTTPTRRLDAEAAAEALARAVALMDDTARVCGWPNVGRDRMPGPWQECEEDGAVAEGEGMFVQYSWAISGMGAFTLPWIEGTGIIPSTTLLTGRALNRLDVHASIALTLRRMNEEVFGGCLCIRDDTDFYATRDIFSLAEPFSASADELLALRHTLLMRGWLPPEDRSS